ncbi:MAG TPA: HEAT repeat domain-containing protein [Candidatus Eremiobacteraceae bacterium]|nr:HEAT repeat domain-containing protein [Candidatus Eremiobacteraceae bacterium]
MPIGRVSAALYIACLVAAGAIGQENPPTTIIKGGGGLASLTEQLKQHHVELTEAGLLKALRDTDAQVRYLAALRLAEVKDAAAVPAIEEALEAEKVPETRMNITIALVQLGDEKGIVELTSDCKDPELPGYFRARAMLYMLPRGSKVCFKAALDLLSTDPDSRAQVVSLLPQYLGPSKEESNEVLEATAKCLTDESPGVRIQAAYTLRTLANPSAIPLLRSAIAAEPDDDVRSQMQYSLGHLEGGQHR